MANGTIPVPTQQIETGTPTIIWNKASLASWGSVNYAKYGKMVIVSWLGLRFSQAISSPTAVLELPYKIENMVCASFPNEVPFVVQTEPNTNAYQILFNGYGTANKNTYGFLVYLTND